MDYKVPGNDDAIRAIRLFCSAVADAVNEGKMIYEQSMAKGDDANADVLQEAAGDLASPEHGSPVLGGAQ